MTQQKIAHRLLLLTLLVAFTFFLLANNVTFAQGTPSPTVPPVPALQDDKFRPSSGLHDSTLPSPKGSSLSEADKEKKEEVRQDELWKTQKMQLATGILYFGAVLLLLQMAAMLFKGQYWDQWSYRLFGLSIIVISSIFLIIVGYNQEQIAGVMGLLGTALGYLLGKSDVGNPVKPDSTTPPPPSAPQRNPVVAP